MGYPMAQNLRSKMPATSILVICDIVESVLDKFTSETSGRIKIANTPREVSQQSVSYSQFNKKKEKKKSLTKTDQSRRSS